MSSEIIKERLFGALLDVVEGLSRCRSVLIVVEDAHWIDPTSRELLDTLIGRLQHLAVLLLVTARPSFVPPSWLECQECTLMRLPAAHAPAVHDVGPPAGWEIRPCR